MNVTIDDFRRHFDSLSDEGLLAVNREELVELARQCYDAELARRGLHPPPAAAAAPEEQQPNLDLVVVATFMRQDEAKLAEALLKAESIPCYVGNQYLQREEWAYELQLMAPAAVADQAREILAAKVSDEDLAAQAESAEQLAGDEPDGSEEP